MTAIGGGIAVETSDPDIRLPSEGVVDHIIEELLKNRLLRLSRKSITAITIRERSLSERLFGNFLSVALPWISFLDRCYYCKTRLYVIGVVAEDEPPADVNLHKPGSYDNLYSWCPNCNGVFQLHESMWDDDQ